MLKVKHLCFTNVTSSLRVSSSIQGKSRRLSSLPCFPSLTTGKTKQARVVVVVRAQAALPCTCTFQRQFTASAFLSDEKQLDSDASKGNEELSADKKDSYSHIGEALQAVGTDFLGIEVLPEIFDKLPPKCTGCGAILQSAYVDKPGYIPADRNPSLSKDAEENCFKPETICMRCFNIKHYNKDCPPVVSPEAISNFLMHISRRKALILYVVDIMDIPGSFVPDILRIVGETKHLILICNKLDRLAVDGHPRCQVKRIKEIISNEAANSGFEGANVKDICVLSAKTGYGIPEMVRKITKYWRKNSDIYLVGSNNSGKTTLFNLLADLFSASRQVDNMLQRGTTSPSPGTTLSLLRFPITYHRFLRLKDRLRRGYLEEVNKEKLKEVELSEDIINRQMTKYRDVEKTSKSMTTDVQISVYWPQFVTRGNEDDIRWLYDTPGVYSKNQISHLLTNQELKMLNPTLWFVPRTVILRPEKTLFLGGLARLDFLEVKRLSRFNSEQYEDIPKASQSVFFTVFASPNLPVHITSSERADMVYEEHAGSELLKVPCGGKERMQGFPGLSGRKMQVTGVDWKRSAADIVLSNVGWIAVTAGASSIVMVKAYTPSGAGLYLRDPPLLPTSVRQRGRRGVPYLGHVNRSIYQGTRKKSPSLLKYLTEENDGTVQWMKVAEKKRKQQRLLLKFEKTKWHAQKKLGFSAKSNPSRYLVDCEDFPLPESEEAPVLESEEWNTDRKEVEGNSQRND